jgi:hypothetical protein
MRFQRLNALADRLLLGQVLPWNPESVVSGPKHRDPIKCAC